MVPELRRERERSTLNLPELTQFIDGGEFTTEKRRKMCESDRDEYFSRANYLIPFASLIIVSTVLVPYHCVSR